MNKEDVLQYLHKEGACDAAINWFIEQEGTLEEIYNECWVDWRIWLHDNLVLDPDPYDRYYAVARPAYNQYQLIGTIDAYNMYLSIANAAWEKCQNETMKDWSIVEKALQERIAA